ncbi:hypothetical protein LTR37_018778 [Vermiconidia calcicola]|uniref:Uncharacterized protein n=1 Tax=Vermiconidia calcicola TaxID=1690605 RepID=A0ACC3MG75_9PEZI|nr:hypothetical protein LTR37_018778 [Vermiconidia calcicola]
MFSSRPLQHDPPNGPKRSGNHQDGYMSAQLQNPDSKEDTKEAQSYIAYTGHFYLDEEGDSHGPLLVHEMRNSNMSQLVGDRQRRLCEIKEESDGYQHLYLSVKEPIKMGGEDRIPLVHWRRLEDNQAAREPGGEKL